MTRRRTAPQKSGFLNIDKPPGWTSHDVVARVRRIVGERRVGHSGTLDPAATGVLPVAVGHATKVLQYLEHDDKTYLATVRFGVETDSGDRDGRLVARASAEHVDAAAVREVLAGYLGQQTQTPPMQSAVRVAGRRLHELARKGEQVDIPQRTVKVYQCDMVSWSPPEAMLLISCSKGTYIRSIARDIGRNLGCGATLINLLRVRAGAFHLRSSISIHDLEPILAASEWEWPAFHPDFSLSGCDIVVLTTVEEQRWANGQEVVRSGIAGDVCVYGADRQWVGTGVFDETKGVVRPNRVILERQP